MRSNIQLGSISTELSRLNFVILLIDFNSISSKMFYLQTPTSINLIIIINLSISNFTENDSSLEGRIIFTNEDINFSKSCGLINPKFFTVSNRFYAEAQKYNSCLYKKIALDRYGNIKNCLSLEKTIR